MPNRLNIFTAIPSRNVIFFTVLTVIMVILYFMMVQIPSAARVRIVNMLENAGFNDAKVQSVSVGPYGVLAQNIKLDQFGFDEIKTLHADINWKELLTDGEVTQIDIKGLSIARQPDNLSSTGRQLVTNLMNLPPYRITITDAKIDLGTDFGDIRITGEVTINGNIKDGKGRDIKAHIKGEQYQLGFDSAWEGALGDDGKLELTGNLQDGHLNIGPLRISRFNGWLGTSVAKDGFNVQSQMEAGSASFMDIPLHDLSLVNDHSMTQNSVIFRSGIAGQPDVHYAADYLQNEKSLMFTSILKGENLGRFLHLVEATSKTKKAVPSALDQSAAFELTSQFQPDRRFVGGPLPFTLTLTTNDKKQADGNLLFYPDTYDVRGSVETDTAMASAMQSYFRIPSANVKQNFIRLDGSAKSFFHLQEKETAVK